jgi:hypothetical protein
VLKRNKPSAEAPMLVSPEKYTDRNYISVQLILLFADGAVSPL